MTQRAVVGNTPLWAASAEHLGHTDPGRALKVNMLLAGQDPAGLARHAQKVSDPHSPSYRHFLTAQQALDRYGTSHAQLERVKAWVRAAGLKATVSGPHSISVQGKANRIEAAFGTRIDEYRVDGHTVRAPARSVSVPHSLAGDVFGITGLDTRKSTHSASAHKNAPSATGTTSAADATGTAGTAGATDSKCSSYYGEKPATDLPKAYGRTVSWEPCGYTPAQIRSAYGIKGTGLTGKGAKVAILAPLVSPTLLKDANTFAAHHGEQPFAPGQLTLRLPSGAPQIVGDDEGAMDLEAVHAVAPDAAVTFAVGTGHVTGNSVLDALTDVVDHRLADVLTSSYLEGDLPGDQEDEAPVDPALVKATEQSLQQAAVEGISTNFASGDGGSLDNTKTPQMDYPGSSPWTTAVGGTSLAIGAKGEYKWEMGWESDASTLADDGKSWAEPLPGAFSGGAGGGVSTVFPQPDYQRDAVPAALSSPDGKKPMRTMPDIAAVADFHTGIRFGVSYPSATAGQKPQYKEEGNGGTSLSSPLIAGMEALSVQAAGGKSLGFVNPTLYALRGTGTYHDITDHPSGAHEKETLAAEMVTSRTQEKYTQVFTLGQSADSGLVSRVGYDTITGLGSPTGKFYKALAGK
ncbi:protease pro-enzyme activation domain-containing protein [Streptomyces sp. NPDC057654]|uniref:S53 family peptidase n=1 Tax=Streptomyces sp. NPDC057654 TaxID=3346196 RepID=UPI0036793988